MKVLESQFHDQIQPGWKIGIFTEEQCKDQPLSLQVSSVAQSCLSVTPWTAASWASLSITNYWSFLKLMCFESVMPSNHLILCCPLLLLPSIFPSIRVFFNESVLLIKWPKCWSFSISPSNEYSGLISFRKLGLTGWISLQSNTTVQKHQFFGAQPLQSSSHIHI